MEIAFQGKGSLSALSFLENIQDDFLHSWFLGFGHPKTSPSWGEVHFL